MKKKSKERFQIPLEASDLFFKTWMYFFYESMTDARPQGPKDNEILKRITVIHRRPHFYTQENQKEEKEKTEKSCISCGAHLSVAHHLPSTLSHSVLLPIGTEAGRWHRKGRSETSNTVQCKKKTVAR